MRRCRDLLSPWLSAAAIVLTACAAPAPYVYKQYEFVRNAPGFGQEPADIEGVGICYNSQGTNPDEIRAMAGERCRQYGKVARFSHQEYLRCSLSAPAYAHFDCLAAPAR